MWKRIEYADWVDLVPVLAFVLTFTVFVVLVARAFLMKKDDLNELAALPLEDPVAVRKERDTKGMDKAGTTAAPDLDRPSTAS